MVASVVEIYRDVHHRIAGEYATVHSLANSLLHRVDELGRNNASLDVVDELEVVFAGNVLCLLCVRIYRLEVLHLNLHVAVLTLTAGLLDVLVLNISGSEDSLAVCHLRLAYVCLDIELALHAVNENFKVKLTHAGHDGLAGFLIGRNLEGWVFVRKLPERKTHFLLVCFRLRLDAKRHHRLGEADFLENERMVLVAERVRGLRVLKTHERCDFSGEYLLHFLALIRLKAHDASDALLGARVCVVNV